MTQTAEEKVTICKEVIGAENLLPYAKTNLSRKVRSGLLIEQLSIFSLTGAYQDLLTTEGVKVAAKKNKKLMSGWNKAVVKDILDGAYDTILSLPLDPSVMINMLTIYIKSDIKKWYIKKLDNAFWNNLEKRCHEDSSSPELSSVASIVTQAAVTEVAAVAETTVSDIHIPTMEEMSADNERISAIYSSSNTYGGGGGSSSGEISALGWLGIAAVGAAALYGGYHLWNSDETEDTIVVDIDEAF